MTIRRRTPGERAAAFVRKLNEPARRKRAKRTEWASPQQIREEFREARQQGRRV